MLLPMIGPGVKDLIPSSCPPDVEAEPRKSTQHFDTLMSCVFRYEDAGSGSRKTSDGKQTPPKRDVETELLRVPLRKQVN